MAQIILMTESASDMTVELANKYGICLVPMHITFGDVSLNDGTFPPEKILTYYKDTKKIPKTSGSTPEDFCNAFDTVHRNHPMAHILYLAYSAVTTVSYSSAKIAAEGRDYVTMLDTRHVSGGLNAVVIKVAMLLEKEKSLTVDRAVEISNNVIDSVRMFFIPDNLEFLRAGGRLSNAAYVGSKLLKIHPVIETIDGKLVATKKSRGKFSNVVYETVLEYSEKNKLSKDLVWLIRTVGISDETVAAVEEAVKEYGFKQVEWLTAQSVITTHGGPGAFGLAGYSEE